ncbi:MAG: cytochrome c [Polyangiaceae bacterium]
MPKKLGLALSALFALLVLAVIVKFYVLSPRLRPALDVHAPHTPEAIARGKYLVDNVTGCLGCHSPIDEAVSGEPPLPGRLGSGRDFGVIPDFPGRIRAPNLTPDPETGIATWSDGELLRAMREGVSRNGRPLFPMMPYGAYGRALDDDDALAIVAYLRTLAPIKNDAGRTELDFPVSMFVRAAPAPLEKSPPPAPLEILPPDPIDPGFEPPRDALARGQWLLTMCSCHDCHDSVNGHREPIPGKALAGDVPQPIAGKGTVYSANISSDPVTGIGAYSDADLLRALNEGKGKSGATLYGMPWRYYAGMTEADKRALILALRKALPVVNAVRPATFPR